MSEKVCCPLCSSLVIFGKGDTTVPCPYCHASVTLDRLMCDVYATPEQGGEAVRRRVDER